MSAKRVKKGDYGLAALQFIDRTEQTEETPKEEPEAEKATGEPVGEETQIEGQTAFAGFDPREVTTETSKGEREPEAITPIEKTEPNAATPTDAPIGKSEPETETPEPIARDESVQAKPIQPITRASSTGKYEGETELQRLYREVSRTIDPKHGFFEIADTPGGGVVYTQQKKSKRVQVVMQPTQHEILKEIARATGEKPNGLISEYVWRGIKQYYEDFERQRDEQEREDSKK